MLFATSLDKKTRLLLLCGPIGCMLCIVVFIVVGMATSDYSSLKHPVSSLSLNGFGWVQKTNFIISGILIFAFAFGLRKATLWMKGSPLTSVIIGAVGVGLIGAGAFSSDPIYGYPTTEPLSLKQVTLEGKLHEIASYLVLFGLPVTCFRFRNRFKHANDHLWAAYSMVSGIAILIGLILAGIGFKQTPILVDVAGVFQRFSIIVGCAWLTLLSFYILKTAKWHERIVRTPFHSQ